MSFWIYVYICIIYISHIIFIIDSYSFISAMYISTYIYIWYRILLLSLSSQLTANWLKQWIKANMDILYSDLEIKVNFYRKWHKLFHLVPLFIQYFKENIFLTPYLVHVSFKWSGDIKKFKICLYLYCTYAIYCTFCSDMCFPLTLLYSCTFSYHVECLKLRHKLLFNMFCCHFFLPFS